MVWILPDPRKPRVGEVWVSNNLVREVVDVGDDRVTYVKDEAKWNGRNGIKVKTEKWAQWAVYARCITEAEDDESDCVTETEDDDESEYS